MRLGPIGGVHTTDDDVSFLNLLRLGKVLLDGLPLETPEQIDARRHYNALAQPDSDWLKRLTHTVRRRYDITIDQRHVQTPSMAVEKDKRWWM